MKRGRGAVGSRMDETGPYLPKCPDTMANQLAFPDLAATNVWKHHANFRQEKTLKLKSLSSSDDDSFEDKPKKKKKKKGSSSKENRKHESKAKSKDKKRTRKEERRHKKH